MNNFICAPKGYGLPGFFSKCHDHPVSLANLWLKSAPGSCEYAVFLSITKISTYLKLYVVIYKLIKFLFC